MNEELDPDIAGRFAALDDVQPPDTWPGIATSVGASRSRRRRRVAAAAALVAVAGLGALVLANRPEPDRVVSTPSTVAPISTTASAPTTVVEGFTPPRRSNVGVAAYPVTLLDGSKILVTLPAELDFDATGFEAAATLESADEGALPPIAIDVTFCPACVGPHTLHFGGWAVTGSGDDLDDEVWAAYTELLEGEVTDDGYLVLSGPIRLGPIDSPDGVLVAREEARVSLFLRDCAGGGPNPHSATGLSVRVMPSKQSPAVTELCAARQGIEVWITGPALNNLVDAVKLTVRRIGPAYEASIRRLFEEPADLVFPVCWELPENGPPEGEAAAALEEVGERLEAAGLRDLEFLSGFSSSPSNVWGRITVSLSRRYGPSIDWLAQHAGPDELCFQFLADPGPPDEVVSPASWRVGPSSLPVDEHWEDLTLLVPGGEDECGFHDPSRVLEPEIDYRADEIGVTVPIAVWERGPSVLPYNCPPPTAVRVRLTEPPDGRPLVAG